jgi:hypothetical protein
MPPSDPKKKDEGVHHVRLKTQISIVSRREMTSSEQASFSTAVNALLMELIQRLDRRHEGDHHGTSEEQNWRG